MSKKDKTLEDWVDEIQATDEATVLARNMFRMQQELTRTKTTNKALLKEVEHAEKRLNTALELADHKVPKPLKAKVTSKAKRHCVPIALASDWHIEERVNPATVNNLNEYDPTISKQRAESFFRNMLWMINYHSDKYAIDTAVLWLGGDIINGFIHEEFVENNYMAPIPATLLGYDYCISGIDFIINEAKINKLIVLCNWGNHGRTTKERRISTGAQNNLEWMMYNLLKKHYLSNPSVDVHVEDGQHLYQQVYDWNIRFHHGETIGYQGGVGGLGIPFRKAVDSWNQSRGADLTCIGHFHQLTRPWPDLLINGSLIGWNPFAIAIKARFEHPRQAFFLMDRTRGACMESHIYVTEEGRMLSGGINAGISTGI